MAEKNYKDSSDTFLSVTIIIPVFNDQEGLNRCLQAISLQTYPFNNLEVIIVDNGSKQPIILESLTTYEVKLIECKTPGSYAARNAGVKVAKNDIFCFIDADCWPDKDWLKSSIATLKIYDGKSIVGGEVKVIKPQKPTSVALYQYITGFDQKNNIKNKGFSVTANLTCFRRQFKQVGFFSETLFSGGDLEWSLRASKNSLSIVYDSKSIVYTEPRTTLRSAIIQARRVTAGRKVLRELNVVHVSAYSLAKKRTPWQAIIFIFSKNEFSVFDRIRVICVASIIRAAELLETIKLALGSKAERR
ncbi:glycosyltransferase [Acinetobacter celticus]|uniref:Glycosyltransferase 2-like domain-containing protein n=1 Tax=Acinetobacter celticus TaxID=1891224 RepID=A0A1C3CTU2_9GAMM|nr:glycosyltransferase [Acinetobacter celticus]ODA12136.1 hypothetical protein BBP83_11700 [Acinetobacter celticus]